MFGKYDITHCEGGECIYNSRCVRYLQLQEAKTIGILVLILKDSHLKNCRCRECQLTESNGYKKKEV